MVLKKVKMVVRDFIFDSSYSHTNLFEGFDSDTIVFGLMMFTEDYLSEHWRGNMETIGIGAALIPELDTFEVIVTSDESEDYTMHITKQTIEDKMFYRVEEELAKLVTFLNGSP